MTASSSPPVVVVAGPVRPGDAPQLCDRVRSAQESVPGTGTTVICDVSGVTSTDLVTVDALARMGLAARRGGGRIRLRDPSPELALLLTLAGLAEALGCSGGQPVRDPEQREPPLAEVEEAVETGDPAV
ncbi:STAS domain-containing protein [Streptomyces kunmingensis]|uniref:STAS domain-containing protein n=1 Tax=Streptomyces kunmingensis TaxID=68225 RepID=A0ABU6CHG0_9ACTN|nr:STAS domain-containing protein [Streptomyces kunmingensis]MEB3964151.1 STAS domain-containing protein [Streptomyces kunmingensis]